MSVLMPKKMFLFFNSHRRSACSIGFCLILISCLFFSVLSAPASQPQAQKTNSHEESNSNKIQQDTAKKAEEVSPPAQATAEEGFDIVLLMDSSGSMKRTDPRDYRKEAAKLFVSLMATQDSISIVSFGDHARELAPLTSASKSQRPILFQAITKIKSSEMTTNIPEALKCGFEILNRSKRKNRIMLLMSDGKIDLLSPEKDEAAAKELQQMLPEIAKAGIRIYSVAFSELSDAAFLRALAENTGGAFRYAQTDRDIHIVFSSIFERLKTPDALSLEGDTFLVDKDVKEAVLLINKLPGTMTVLYDPAGHRVVQGKITRDIEWFGSKVFDMITIRQPAVGKWKIRLSTKTGNKIFILTDLKLKTTFNKDRVTKGTNVVVDAWLERDGLAVQSRDVLSQIGFFADLIEPDSTKHKFELKPAGKDGIFALDMAFRKPGEHTLILYASGKTFTRTREFVITVDEPIPQAVKEPASLQQAESAEPKSPLPQLQVDVNWRFVLIEFAAVNAVLIGMIVGVISVRKGFRVVRNRKTAQQRGTVEKNS